MGAGSRPEGRGFNPIILMNIPKPECDCWRGKDWLLCWFGLGLFCFLCMTGCGACTYMHNKSMPDTADRKIEIEVQKSQPKAD
jgi:hypothetical protein